MRIKSFSLIEVIFLISIISIILVVATPKFSNSLNSTNNLKIKNDILLIRNAFNQNKNKQILALNNLSSSDTDDIINSIVRLSSDTKTGEWNKLSSNHYKVWISSNKSLEFIYDISNNSFDCNKDDINCMEYTQ